MEIYLEPHTIDSLSEQLQTKQSCIGLVIGKAISDVQFIIQDLLPLNLRPNIFATHVLDKLVLKRQELEQFSEHIEMLQPEGLETIGIWTYSQAAQTGDLEMEYLRLCQLLFYVDEEKPPPHSFVILNFKYDQKAGFHISSSHCPSYDLIEKAKLVIGGFPPAFSLRRVSTVLQFKYSLKPRRKEKVDELFTQVRKNLKQQLDDQTLFFLEGNALTPQDSTTSLAQLSSSKEIKIQTFQKEKVKGIAQIEEDQKLSLQWSSTYPVVLYIEGGATLKQVREELVKRVLQQFDEGIECARQSQGQPNAFQMDSEIIDRVDYFNLYIPRTIHFSVRGTLYKDYLLPSEKEQSAKQRLQKLFGSGAVELIERGNKAQNMKVEEKVKRNNCFQNRGILMGVGLGLVCVAWGLLFI